MQSRRAPAPADRDAPAHRTYVLLVDGDRQVQRILRGALDGQGYEMAAVVTGEAALAAVAQRQPDLVLLDLSLPDMHGLDVCRRIREWSWLPIIVVSGFGDDRLKARVLDDGADDYVTKPFSQVELLARMRAALRRAGRQPVRAHPVLRLRHLEIDLARHAVRCAGREVHLTPTEYGLLRHLAKHAGRVIGHADLLRAVLGPGYESAMASLRVYVASLRKKLEDDPAHPQLLLTRLGVGYCLSADEAPTAADVARHKAGTAATERNTATPQTGLAS